MQEQKSCVVCGVVVGHVYIYIFIDSYQSHLKQRKYIHI